MTETHPGEIVGTSEHAEAQRAFVEEASQSVAPVMLVGEPGTGKQLLARLTHEASPRSQEPFLMIDCSLYYERELKRELFGYSRGGSGMKVKKGLLEFASKGTCYLARVEELTPDLQSELLQFLVDGGFERLGDGKQIRSSARLMVSSDKNLKGFVDAGLFDQELFGRLSTLGLSILPLRQRSEDIPTLVQYIVRRQGADSERAGCVQFSREAMQALESYPWQGNVDELLQEVERLTDSGLNTVRAENLSMEIANFWLGQKGDPDVRRVLEELDGYIREFKILSRLESGFGEPAPSLEELLAEDWMPHRDLLEEF